MLNLRGGKLVDANPEILKLRESELEKLNTQYGGDKGVDMTQFPQFQFTGMYNFSYMFIKYNFSFIKKLLYKFHISV